MVTTVGLFRSRAEAEDAAVALRAVGIRRDRITVLTPDRGTAPVGKVPTTDAEPPGVGPTLGGVVGAAAGASGAAALAAFVPMVGPILAFGIAAGALIGALGGAAAGEALEESLGQGVPKDEVFWYAQALREGHSVLVVLADDDAQLEMARQLLQRAGAESLDAARERWWLGLRPAEAAEYATGRDLASDEAAYRRGFEAALAPDMRDRRFEDVVEYLRGRDPELVGSPVYRRGFERGQAYLRRLGEERRTPYAA
jgi:hypothetical protein